MWAALLFLTQGDSPMLRKLAFAVVALGLCAVPALADEVKGKIKSVDADKKTVTVTVDGKDMTLNVDEKAEILNANGKALKDGLKGLKEGTEVTVTCEKKDGKDCCTK